MLVVSGFSHFDFFSYVATSKRLRECSELPIFCFAGHCSRCIWWWNPNPLRRWVSYKCYTFMLSDVLMTVVFVWRWQPDSKFPYSQVRFPPKPDAKVEFVENQEVEVYSRANNQEANGWWKCRIKVITIDNLWNYKWSC